MCGTPIDASGLCADVSGLASGAKQAISSLGQVDDATKKSQKEARELRETMNRAIAGNVIAAEAARVGSAHAQLGGQAGAVGHTMTGVGQVIQGARNFYE